MSLKDHIEVILAGASPALLTVQQIQAALKEKGQDHPRSVINSALYGDSRFDKTDPEPVKGVKGSARPLWGKKPAPLPTGNCDASGLPTYTAAEEFPPDSTVALLLPYGCAANEVPVPEGVVVKDLSTSLQDPSTLAAQYENATLIIVASSKEVLARSPLSIGLAVGVAHLAKRPVYVYLNTDT